MAKRAGRRRVAEEWRGLIEELEAGGEDLARFCRRHRIHPSTLKWWRWRLRAPSRESEPANAPAGAFKELRFSGLLEPTVGVADIKFELRWSDGLALRIPQQFDEGALGRLLAVLEAAGC